MHCQRFKLDFWDQELKHRKHRLQYLLFCQIKTKIKKILTKHIVFLMFLAVQSILVEQHLLHCGDLKRRKEVKKRVT